jgi:hypothetical protein
MDADNYIIDANSNHLALHLDIHSPRTNINLGSAPIYLLGLISLFEEKKSVLPLCHIQATQFDGQLGLRTSD